MACRKDKLFLAIAGLIGAGKTTLANKLSEALDLPVVHEPVDDNPYLGDFYGDMQRYGFAMQIYLLNARFRQQQQVIWSKQGGVADRTIYEDGIFARVLHDQGNMDARDYQTYLDLFENMEAFMKAPDVIIYLYVTPEQSKKRIERRSRDVEESIPLEYLEALYQGYEDFIGKITKMIPVIKVPWQEFKDTDEVVQHILKEYDELSMIRTVSFD